MNQTFVENLANDIAKAAQIKLATLSQQIPSEKTAAVDWSALATSAKNALTSPELKNVLRQANQRGLNLGALGAVVKGTTGGINGAIQGYRNAGPGAWNKIKGTMGGSLKGQATGALNGFGAGYATGAGSSIIGDAITGTKDMQALKGKFTGERIKAPAIKSDGIISIGQKSDLKSNTPLYNIGENALNNTSMNLKSPSVQSDGIFNII